MMWDREGVDIGVVDVPSPGPGRGARPGGLVAATHAGPAAAVTVVATLLAVAAGVTAWRGVLVCLPVLAGEAPIGWSSDWRDAAGDRAVAGGDKPVVQGAVSPALLRVSALISVGLAVV